MAERKDKGRQDSSALFCLPYNAHNTIAQPQK